MDRTRTKGLGEKCLALKKSKTKLKRLVYFIPIFCIIIACNDEIKVDEQAIVEEIPDITEEYGYRFNDFEVIKDTIRSGDTFGAILSKYGVSNQTILEVV
jgi:hypothetical protein